MCVQLRVYYIFKYFTLNLIKQILQLLFPGLYFGGVYPYNFIKGMLL